MRPARYFVGIRHAVRMVFRSSTIPTEATHGDQYAAVIGPFRTKTAAALMATPGARYQTVAEAEQVARKMTAAMRAERNLQPDICAHRRYYTINAAHGQHRCLSCGFQFIGRRAARPWVQS